MTDSLAGRVAVVTGASSGIGRETARALTARGAAVAVLGRRVERLQDLADELNGLGARAMACQADVRDKRSLEQAAQRSGSASGGSTAS